jgi:hypothetical protein
MTEFKQQPGAAVFFLKKILTKYSKFNKISLDLRRGDQIVKRKKNNFYSVFSFNFNF